jgi:arsenate reductase (glutaredoxin)
MTAAMAAGSLAIEIWHNPACSVSRNTLALIRDAGIEPTIVEYLQAPPAKARLREAIAAAGIGVRDAIRGKEPAFVATGLDDPSLTDEALLDAMIANPVLINRPFVFSPLGVRLCRPDASVVLDILPPGDMPLATEGGQMANDAGGNRVG